MIKNLTLKNIRYNFEQYMNYSLINNGINLMHCLTDIASIQMGYSFRDKLEFLPSNGTLVIQMKDITESETINVSKLDRIEFDDFNKSQIVEKNDIVLRTRGSLIRSCLVDVISEPVVLAAPNIRVRVNSSKVLPEYLNWYLNSHLGQIRLRALAEGSVQQMVSKQNLEKLELAVPSIAIQGGIVEVAKLAKRENELYKKIFELRINLINQNLLRIIKE
jgi:restriction endonuclease S subunit